MEASQVVKALAALAQPVRLQLFRALVVTGPQGLTPGTMAEGLGVSASALSFHLKELVHAGLVRSERVGRNLVYRAEFAQMDALLGYLTLNCCAGACCEVAPAAARAGAGATA
ncbi:MAG: ArsR family transcriptional regulator [Comamonadaceae bacterium]|nr:MAG: ArsR family transcriptional regulator [Comamonadaceae bacterium]